MRDKPEDVSTLAKLMEGYTWREICEAWQVMKENQPKSCPIYRKIGAENLKIGETISIEISIKNEAKKVVESCRRFARKKGWFFVFKTVPGSEREFIITRLR